MLDCNNLMIISMNQTQNPTQLDKIQQICSTSLDITNQQIRLMINMLAKNMKQLIKHNKISHNNDTLNKNIISQQNSESISRMLKQKISNKYQQKIRNMEVQIKQINNRISQNNQVTKNLSLNQNQISKPALKTSITNQQVSKDIRFQMEKHQRQLHFILLKLGVLFKQPQVVPVPIQANTWIDQQAFNYKNIKFINSKIITLQNRGRIFSKHQIIYGQKCKYSLFFQKLNNAVYFGVADQTFRKMQYFSDNTKYFYYGSQGTSWDGINSKEEQGPNFGETDTITMIVDTIQGTIQWQIGKYKRKKCECKKLKQDSTTIWVPFVMTSTNVFITFVQ